MPMTKADWDRKEQERWPLEQIRTWIEEEDRTQRWVAEQLCCANQTISKLCRKHGIQTAKRGPRPGSKHYAYRGGKNGGQGSYQARKMLRLFGVTLLPGRVIHHLNLDSKDQRLENLWVFPSQSEHLAWHRKIEEEARAVGIPPLYDALVQKATQESYPPGPDLLGDAIGLHRPGPGAPPCLRKYGQISI